MTPRLPHVGSDPSCFSSRSSTREVPWECSSSSECDDPDVSANGNRQRSVPMWRRRLSRRRRDEPQGRTRSYTTGDVVVSKPDLECKNETEWRRSTPTPPPFMQQVSFSSVGVDESSSNPEWWETPEDDPRCSHHDAETQSSSDSSYKPNHGLRRRSVSPLVQPMPQMLTSIVFHSLLDVAFLLLATAFAVLETSVVWLVHNNRLLRWMGQSVVYVAAHVVRYAGYSPKTPPLKDTTHPTTTTTSQPSRPLRWRLRRTSQQQQKENALRRKRLLRRDI